jgi:ribonuclease P protein component
MLKRPSRLSREGVTATSRGKRLTAPHFSISYAPLGGQAAVVVSKKTARKSVDRHLLKRRVMAILAPHTGKKHSFVVYARGGAAALPFRMVKAELEPLLATLDA